MKTTTDKPLCFVVQGFGSKTDYTDGRVLDLDASYEVIKAAVERAGLRCQRADEIVHAGTIDIPMYEQLLQADLVIADLSTNNLNAAFELGVRFALRPRTTMVVAESKFKSPFNINHIVIRRYEHLGPDVGAKEARRFEKELAAAIKTILAQARVDSPVYTLLPQLRAPQLMPAQPGVAPRPPQDTATPPRRPGASGRLPSAPGAPGATTGKAGGSAPKPPPSARDWLDRAQRAMAADDYPGAVRAWEEVRRFNPNDPQATQQLALAIYRARRPSETKALDAARGLLAELSPTTTNDPETVNLWAAIHQRRWDRGHELADLSEALSAFERALALKGDHYNAAHLAHLLQVRADQHLKAQRPDAALADWVRAQDLWHNAQALAEPVATGADTRTDTRTTARFWACVTLWHAAIAQRDAGAQRRWHRRVQAADVGVRRHAASQAQADKLRTLTTELNEQFQQLDRPATPSSPAPRRSRRRAAPPSP